MFKFRLTWSNCRSLANFGNIFVHNSNTIRSPHGRPAQSKMTLECIFVKSKLLIKNRHRRFGIIIWHIILYSVLINLGIDIQVPATNIWQSYGLSSLFEEIGFALILRLCLIWVGCFIKTNLRGRERDLFDHVDLLAVLDYVEILSTLLIKLLIATSDHRFKGSKIEGYLLWTSICNIILFLTWCFVRVLNNAESFFNADLGLHSVEIFHLTQLLTES